MPLTEEMRHTLQTDGCVLLPGLLPESDVARMRKSTFDYFERQRVYYDCGMTQPDAFTRVPDLRWLLDSPQIVEAFKYLVGEPLVYCHHSDIHFNKFTGWHKDACGHDDFVTEPDGGTYGVYKIAFYMQDHAEDNPAFYIRKGSHLIPRHEGEVKAFSPKIGDAVMFDCRITHKGEDMSKPAKVLREAIPSQVLRSKVFGALRKINGRPDKLSLFYTLGRPNRFTEEHVAITVDRQNQQNRAGTYSLPPEIADIVTRVGWGISPLRPASDFQIGKAA